MKGIKVLLPVSVIILLALSSCQGTPPPTSPPTSPPPTTPSPPADVTITLTAQRIAFDQATITVPAGVRIKVVFINNESIVTHNFAVYESSAATKAIFVGSYVSAGNSIDNEFTAPSTPGSYYFRCDVHPTLMRGELIVTPPVNK